MGTAVDLQLWGHPVRVRAEVPEAANAIRSGLPDYVQAEPAPLGFVVKPPDTPRGLHYLLDRSGLVLARARAWQDCVAVLVEHLAAFAPPPANTIRMSVRAVLRGDDRRRGVVLAGFPLLSMPPLVERQLERRGQRVLDRLAIDMTPEGTLALADLPWPQLRRNDPGGHCGTSATGAPIEAVLLPASVGVSLKRYQVVALIASTITNLTPESALDVAERLSDRAGTIPINDVVARRRALER